MKKFFLFFLVVLFSCSSENHNIKIPDNFIFLKTSGYTQVKGTKVFIKIPVGFHMQEKEMRIEKDNDPDTYLQLVESQGTDFLTLINKMKNKIENIKNEGGELYYQKEFKIGYQQAILIYGRSTQNENMDQFVLNYGTNEFAISISSQFNSTDTLSRRLLLETMLTSYEDEFAEVDRSLFSDYKIDFSGTNFKLSKHLSQMSYYTINGEGDPTNDPFIDYIMVTSQAPLKNESDLLNYSHFLVQKYENNGVKISINNESKLKINNYSAYEISFTANYQNKELSMYQIVICNEKLTILFFGSAFNNKNQLLSQFKSISETIKLE